MSDEMTRYNVAIKVIQDLCEGRRSWSLSIPVQLDYDPDVILAASLNDVPALLQKIQQMETDNAPRKRQWLTFHRQTPPDPATAAEALADLPVEWRKAFVTALANGLPSDAKRLTLNRLVAQMVREYKRAEKQAVINR